MAVGTFYWQKKGAAATTGTGTNADPFDGSKALDNAIDSGAVSPGSTIIYRADRGAMTIASEAADWPATSSFSTALAFTNSIGGIFLGTNDDETSTCRDMIFEDILADFRGGTTSQQRQVAAFRWQGVRNTVRKAIIISADNNYIQNDSTGAVRVGGKLNPEDSFENCGVLCMGEGNTVEDCDIWGADRFGCYGIYIGQPTAAQGADGNQTTTIRRNWVRAFANNIYVQGNSSLSLLAPNGTNVDCYHNKSGPGVWGVKTGLPVRGYNAAWHGNGISVRGFRPQDRGWVQISGNEIFGDAASGTRGHQDMVSASGRFVVVRGNYIHDSGPAQNQYWVWGGSNYSLTSLATNTQGNGVKTGLTGYDGTSPTTYLGSNGIAGGSLQTDEVATIVIGNVMRRMGAHGVTANNTCGLMVIRNEMTHCGNDVIDIGVNTGTSSTRIGNCAIVGNYCLKTAAAPSPRAVDIQPDVRICLMLNNISDGAVATISDINLKTNVALPVNRWHKNLWVNNRKTTTGIAFPTGVDVSAQDPGWTIGTGLPVGSALRTAGWSETHKHIRTSWDTFALIPGFQTITIANGTQTIQAPQFRQLTTAELTAPPLGPYVYN